MIGNNEPIIRPGRKSAEKEVSHPVARSVPGLATGHGEAQRVERIAFLVFDCFDVVWSRLVCHEVDNDLNEFSGKFLDWSEAC